MAIFLWAKTSVAKYSSYSRAIQEQAFRDAKRFSSYEDAEFFIPGAQPDHGHAGCDKYTEEGRLPETGVFSGKEEAKSNTGHQAKIFILICLAGKTRLSKLGGRSCVLLAES